MLGRGRAFRYLQVAGAINRVGLARIEVGKEALLRAISEPGEKESKGVEVEADEEVKVGVDEEVGEEVGEGVGEEVVGKFCKVMYLLGPQRVRSVG